MYRYGSSYKLLPAKNKSLSSRPSWRDLLNLGEKIPRLSLGMTKYFMKKSRHLSEETVFESKFFKVTRANVERNGKTFVKDIVERRPFVLILPISENNEIYLVRQYRDALRKFSLEVVAGAMDVGEEPLEAAKRELQEEAGLSADSWKQLSTFHVSANMRGNAHLFLARGLTEGQATPDEDEELELVKMPIAEAVTKIHEGEIDVSSNVASLLLLDSLLKEGKV